VFFEDNDFMSEETKEPIEKLKQEGSIVWEIIKTIVGVALFVFVFRFFVIQPFYIIGSSMEPDFHQAQYLFIDEFSYLFRGPARGEVIVFKHPEATCTAYVEGNPILQRFNPGPCTDYIKRVIGLPGETVILHNGKFTIKNKEHPDGFTLNETYIAQGVTTLGDQTVTLGNDEYFVVGDNREPNASYDSRAWGPVKREFITGRAWLRLLPPQDFSFIPTAKY
jgi:signal peptidase I